MTLIVVISASISYSPDGSFIDHTQSVTLVVRAGYNQEPILCWILLVVLLLGSIISIVVICYFCLKNNRTRTPKVRRPASTYINGFSYKPNLISSQNPFSPSPSNTASPAEMLPKYVASPAQSYSTQKLYQWCQQREREQYKSLWAVNPTSGELHWPFTNWTFSSFHFNFRPNICDRPYSRKEWKSKRL